MRISTLRGDPGYHEAASHYFVLLDGSLAEVGVVIADEEKGYVVYFRGAAVIAGVPCMEIQYGQVRLILPQCVSHARH